MFLNVLFGQESENDGKNCLFDCFSLNKIPFDFKLVISRSESYFNIKNNEHCIRYKDNNLSGMA